MSWIALLASILAAFCALWIARAEKASKATKRLAAVIACASIVSVIINFHAARAQAKFEQDMRVQTEEMLRQLTGGKGFAVVSLRLSPDPSKILLVVHNDNDHPLYDLSLGIVDLELQHLLEQSGIPSGEAFFKAIKRLGPYNIGPKHVQTFVGWKVTGNDIIRYGINVTARNGYWFQSLYYQRIGNEWLKASRIIRDQKVVHEDVHESYPRGESGEPVW